MISVERESERYQCTIHKNKMFKRILMYLNQNTYIYKTTQCLIDWVSEMFNLGKKLHFLNILAFVMQDTT